MTWRIDSGPPLPPQGLAFSPTLTSNPDGDHICFAKEVIATPGHN
jgi:hypothetical protein